MKKFIKNASRKRAALTIILIAMIIIFPIGIFVAARYRFWLIYGIADSFRKGENGLVSKIDVPMDKTVKIPTASGENINYTNVLWTVNSQYRIPEGEIPYIIEVNEKVSVNSFIKADLDRLFADAESRFGEEIIITSAFRTREFQESIYKTNPYAVPAGTSEHETGLAADLKTDGYAQKRFVLSKTGRWINENAHKYGFIIRYPFWGEDKTGVEYEPWHIRYVGYPHAQIIYRSHITLEEYVDSFELGEFYKFDDYVISRQTENGGMLEMPEGCVEINVSPDNMGGWFVWGKTTDR